VEKEDHTRHPKAVKREEDEKVSTANETSRREEEDHKKKQKREFKNQISLTRTSLITHHV
jgi:hypothetical protein